MKKTTILILSVLTFILAAGCNKIGNGNASSNTSQSNSSAENTTEAASDKTDEKTTQPKTTHKKIYITDQSVTTKLKPPVSTPQTTGTGSDNSSSGSDSSNTSNDDDWNSDSNDWSYDNQNSNSSQDDPEPNNGGGYNGGSSAANSLYQRAMDMYGDVILGCPYDLDYNDTDQNGFAAVDGVSSTDDIASLYCTVFEQPDSYIYERYTESDGKVYCNDSSRGSNIYYSGTDLEYVSGDGNTMTYNAVSHYTDPDTGEALEDKTATFSIEMTDDGYKVTEFSYPK